MQERAHQIYEETYQFHGASGCKYDYYLPQNLDMVPSVAGNYVFAIWKNDRWWILYAGESGDLRDRLVNNQHEKMDESLLFVRPHRVYVLYHANRWAGDKRRKAEKDLIDGESPPLNY